MHFEITFFKKIWQILNFDMGIVLIAVDVNNQHIVHFISIHFFKSKQVAK